MWAGVLYAHSVSMKRTGIVIGTVALVPLVAFAVLWTSLILILGAVSVLEAVGL